MHHQNYLTDAIDQVSAWNLPDEEFAPAVNDLARLMAGLPYPENSFTPTALGPYAPLQF